MKFLVIILMSLASCTSPTVVEDQPELLYKEGDQVCFTTGASHQTVTLLGDVRQEQQTVLAELSNGDTRNVDVVYLSEQINCGRD